MVTPHLDRLDLGFALSSGGADNHLQCFGLCRCRLEQHWDRRRIDEPRGNRDVAIPCFSRCRLAGLPCTPMLAILAPRRNDLLAEFKRGRNAITVIDGRGRAEFLRNRQSVVVKINHDDRGWRIELRSQ